MGKFNFLYNSREPRSEEVRISDCVISGQNFQVKLRVNLRSSGIKNVRQ